VGPTLKFHHPTKTPLAVAVEVAGKSPKSSHGGQGKWEHPGKTRGKPWDI